MGFFPHISHTLAIYFSFQFETQIYELNFSIPNILIILKMIIFQSMKLKNKISLIYFTFFVATLIFLILSLSLSFINDITALLIIKNFYHQVCHQIENRCFLVDGKPMFICSRCTGIYFGSLVLFLLLTIFQSFRKYLENIQLNKILIFSLPFAIDWSINFLFKIETTNFVRFLTGFLISIIPVYLLNHLIIISLKDD